MRPADVQSNVVRFKPRVPKSGLSEIAAWLAHGSAEGHPIGRAKYLNWRLAVDEDNAIILLCDDHAALGAEILRCCTAFGGRRAAAAGTWHRRGHVPARCTGSRGAAHHRRGPRSHHGCRHRASAAHCGGRRPAGQPVGRAAASQHANPFDAIDRLAEKIGSDAYLPPVPMFAATAADGEVLRRQTGVANALALACEADLLIMGVGEATSAAFLSRAGVFSPDDLGALHCAGAAGEALGYFYGPDGRLVDATLHGRVTGLSLEALAAAGGSRPIVAVAADRARRGPYMPCCRVDC